MGQDKGLLVRGQKTWAELAFERLTNACSQVFVSVRSEQMEAYGRIFEPDALIEDSRFDVEGPMRGILSAFDRHPSSYIVLACDLPLLEDSALAELLRARAEHPQIECVAFQTDYVEGLCAFYGQSALADLSKSPGSDFSLERFLKSRRTLFLRASGSLAEQLRNHNTPV